MARITQGNTYIYPFIIKDILKDTDEQPDEELHRVRARRVLSAEAFVLVELGVYHPPQMWMYSSVWKLS